MNCQPISTSSSPDPAECLARLGREIRNSMHLLLGVAEILLESDLAPMQQEYVNVLRTSADRLLSTAGDIVALGTDEGEPVFHVEFDLVELLHQTAELLQSLAGSEGDGLILELQLDPALQRRVSGNLQTLEELLVAVICAATRAGASGRVTLAARPADVPGSTRFTISLPRLEGFTGVDDLDIHFALARKLALGIGDELRIETSPSATVVSFSIQLVPLVLGHLDSAPLRVLLAEDATDSQLLMQAYLKGRNCTVDIAPNGAEAVSRVQATHYDIVFMDLEMPVMDGVEATRRIREYEQSSNSPAVPIVALTACTSGEIANRCVNSGFSAYMAKPVTKKTVLGALASFTSTSERASERLLAV